MFDSQNVNVNTKITLGLSQHEKEEVVNGLVSVHSCVYWKAAALMQLSVFISLFYFLTFSSTMSLVRQYIWVLVIVGMIFSSLVICVIFLLINRCISKRGTVPSLLNSKLTCSRFISPFHERITPTKVLGNIYTTFGQVKKYRIMVHRLSYSGEKNVEIWLEHIRLFLLGFIWENKIKFSAPKTMCRTESIQRSKFCIHASRKKEMWSDIKVRKTRNSIQITGKTTLKVLFHWDVQMFSSFSSANYLLILFVPSGLDS